MAIHTEIEINCSPSEVRKVFHILSLPTDTPAINQFLDFPSYPTWTSGFIKSIVPASTSCAPGTKLHNTFQGMTISPTVLANDAHEFRWRGMLWGIPGLFTGEHHFRFEASESTPGGTRLVQGEKFSGVLAFLIAEGTKFWRETKEGFEGFNADLKRRCEEGEK